MLLSSYVGYYNTRREGGGASPTCPTHKPPIPPIPPPFRNHEPCILASPSFLLSFLLLPPLWRQSPFLRTYTLFLPQPPNSLPPDSQLSGRGRRKKKTERRRGADSYNALEVEVGFFCTFVRLSVPTRAKESKGEKEDIKGRRSVKASFAAKPKVGEREREKRRERERERGTQIYFSQ